MGNSTGPFDHQPPVGAPHDGNQPPLGPPPGPPSGPPPGPPSGPPSGEVNGRVVLAVLAVLALVVGGIVVAAVLLSDDDSGSAGSDDPDGPVAVVEATLSALEDGDCEAAREHAPQLDDTTCRQLQPDGFSYGDVTEGEVDGDEASVHVAVESPDLPEPLDVEVALARDGDRWQVVDWTEPRPLGTGRTCAPGSSGSGCAPVTPEPSPTDPGADTSTDPVVPEQDDTDALEAEITTLGQANIDALKARDCAALKEVGEPQSGCDAVFAEIPDDVQFGEIRITGGPPTVFIQVDLVVDGQSIPGGLQMRTAEQPGRGWTVTGWSWQTRE